MYPVPKLGRDFLLPDARRHEQSHPIRAVPIGFRKEAVTMNDLDRMRHSAAHVMAEAVTSIFPEAKLAIGPPIEEGFYYDFDLPRPLTPDDLAEIEKRMAAIVKKDAPFVESSMTREEAKKFFAERNQPYKVELIEGIGEPSVGIYRQNDFIDLCRGPHVASTGKIGPVKLLNVA